MTIEPFLEELDPIDRTIVIMRRERKTDKEIGATLGLVRTAISKRRQRIARRYGERIFDPSRLLFSPENVAHRLGVPARKIRELLREGVTRPAVRVGAQYFLSEESVQELAAHPAVSSLKDCVVCGRPFTIRRTSRGYLRTVCRNSVCILERRRRWIEKRRINRGLTRLSRRKKYEVLRNLVHHAEHDRQTEWLPRDQAGELAGIDASILKALADKGYIKTRMISSRRQNIQVPLRLYAKHELYFVRYVYREYS